MSDPLVLYIAGVAWDGIEGTDHRMVEQLSRQLNVLWVDPPRPVTRRFRPHPGVSETRSGLSMIGPRLWRLHVVVAPGVSRPVLRSVAEFQWRSELKRAVSRLRPAEVFTVVAHPAVSLHGIPGARRAYYATDDFVAGARLLGMNYDRAASLMRTNIDDADVVFAVSPTLVSTLGGPSNKVRLLPNGCSPDAMTTALAVRENRPVTRKAVLVGQLNDRLDVDLLLTIARHGTNLVLIGPRYENSAETRGKLDQLIAFPNVQWLGRQPFSRIPELLGGVDLGLTPYRVTRFNAASFPLKTLEYLSAGLRVVSTDLPSAHWLNTPMVDIATDSESFAKLTRVRLDEGWSATSGAECVRVAERHSWAMRAEVMMDGMTHGRTSPQTSEAQRHG